MFFLDKDNDILGDRRYWLKSHGIEGELRTFVYEGLSIADSIRLLF